MLDYLKLLPEVIINKIQNYIPVQYLVNLNKNYYNLHNSENRKFIPGSYFNSYIRDVVRNDNSFVLDYVMKEYSTTWNKNKKYKYDNSSYSSYSEFLKQYSLDTISHQCNNLLNESSKNNTSGKQHKKVHSKNNRWRL